MGLPQDRLSDHARLLGFPLLCLGSSGKKLIRGIVLLTLLSCAAKSALSQQQTVCQSARQNMVSDAHQQGLILRPGVRVTKETFSSAHESGGASDAVQAGLQGVLIRAFEDKGYTVPFDLTLPEQWEDTPANKQAITALQADYDALLGDAMPPSFWKFDCSKIVKASLRDDLHAVTANSKFNLIVLARAHGNVTTKSAALDIYGGSDGLDFSIGIIDGDTGQVFYYCGSRLVGKLGGSPNGRKFLEAPATYLEGPVAACLKQYFSGAKQP
jgi:hypothetical protein